MKEPIKSVNICLCHANQPNQRKYMNPWGHFFVQSLSLVTCIHLESLLGGTWRPSFVYLMASMLTQLSNNDIVLVCFFLF